MHGVPSLHRKIPDPCPNPRALTDAQYSRHRLGGMDGSRWPIASEPISDSRYPISLQSGVLAWRSLPLESISNAGLGEQSIAIWAYSGALATMSNLLAFSFAPTRSTTPLGTVLRANHSQGTSPAS